MRFSSRSKVSVPISLTALLILVGAFAFYGFIGGKGTAQAASAATAYKGTLGKAHLVGTTSPSSIAKSTSKSTYHVAPMRSRPKASSKASTVSLGKLPTVVSTAVKKGSLLHNFDGVNAIDNGKATKGYDLEPPDESIAAGKGYVVNFVNLTGAVYHSNGQIAAGPFPLALIGGGGFFNADLNNIVSDPRAYYDASSHTFFALVWEDDYVNGLLGPAYVDLAVNSGDPTQAWTIYKINVEDSTAAGCPCLPDYTILGVDQYNVYLLPNEFQNYGAGGFNGSQIYVIAKSQLLSHNPAPNVVHFSGLSIAGNVVYHLQPANEYSNANAEYFMNALDPNNTYDNRLGVWAMTNRDKIAQGVIPNLSSTVISSETYAMPPNAQTPPGVCPCPALGGPLPTTGIVQSDFDALQEVQYVNGKLYAALNTSVNIAGDNGTRAAVAWFEVTPVVSGGVISNRTKVTSQGYVASRGLYLMYPHIEHSLNGTTAIVFTFGGPGTYLSAGYVVATAGHKFGNIMVAGYGAAPDNGFTGTKPFGGAGRWGDYSAGQLAPDGSGIWFATQYIPNNGDQYANWGNRLFEVAA